MRPRVGIGVIVERDDGQILIGRRSGSHAPKYSIPGGSLEAGETFEAAARRELKEECGIDIIEPEVVAITNNLQTYREDGVHFISVILRAHDFVGTPRIMEPDKSIELGWYDPHNLPQPHFDASANGVWCYLSSKFYRPVLK
jgi:8-oxo-dGTP diphosphatase